VHFEHTDEKEPGPSSQAQGNCSEHKKLGETNSCPGRDHKPYNKNDSQDREKKPTCSQLSEEKVDLAGGELCVGSAHITD
jgi:hypothetical protein